MRLEDSLILDRYFHSLLRVHSLEELKQVLVRTVEGPGPDGQSQFFHVIATLRGLDRSLKDKLPEYDARIVGYETRLAKARGGFAFK